VFLFKHAANIWNIFDTKKFCVDKEQDREIGRLEERIRQMTIEKEKHVSDAPISGTANVG